MAAKDGMLAAAGAFDVQEVRSPFLKKRSKRLLSIWRCVRDNHPIHCANIMRWPSGVATAISRQPHGLSWGGDRMMAPPSAKS